MKKFLFLLFLALMVSTIVLANYTPVGTGKTAADFGAKTVVIIHYHRFDNNYTGWNLWVWPTKPTGKNGKAYPFLYRDAYGPYAIVKFNQSYTQVGFIVRLDNWKAKDVAVNRYINIPPSGVAEIWVLEGQKNYWTNVKDVNTSPRIMAAFLNKLNTVDAYLTKNINLKNWKKEISFTLNGKNWQISKVVPAIPGEALNTNYIQITFATPLNTYQVADSMVLKVKGFLPQTVYAYEALNATPFHYNGQLGAIYSTDETTFKVWSPISKSAELLLFKSSSATSPYSTYKMTRNSEGVWTVRVPGNLNGVYYLYKFYSYGKYREALDIYSHAANASNTKSMVVNLLKTNPIGWNITRSPVLKEGTNAIVYETSVRDFTAATSSGVPTNYRGKYLGFTVHNTSCEGFPTGIDHLKWLGVTDVQLLPIEDFWNVPLNAYNWGYVPYLYMVPEAQYSSNPSEPATTIYQVKRMIESLHKVGIGVILDISFSHTSSVGKGSAFDQTVPYYYYRVDKSGQYLNQSGVGNTLKTGDYMMRKYIIDTLKYWVEEYHVNGFRLDQLALLNANTVKAFVKALISIDPHIILYGEPWGPYFTYGDQGKMHIGFFNSYIYNAINGAYDLSSNGFSTGARSKNILIERGVVGETDYSYLVNGFAFRPDQCVNYVSSHDGYTLWDRINKLEKDWTFAQKLDAQKLSLAIILTSQGIPFLYGGTEFARTKYGNSNSYNAPDRVNELKWSRLKQFDSLNEYIKGLITLRKAHPAFRMDSVKSIKEHLKFFPTRFKRVNKFLKLPIPLVAYEISGNANGDSWKNIIVIYNGATEAVKFKLPNGKWDVVVNGQFAGVNTLEIVSGSLRVLPTSAYVLYQK